MSAQKTIRLQDIANQAGVSKATVSLALRNHASIPSETRKRIQELAAKMGYRPNPLVSALMTYQRSSQANRAKNLTLALVMDFSRNGRWHSFLSPDLLSTAAARAEEHGYRIEEFWLEDLKMTGQRLSSVLYQRSVPGFIVAPLPTAHGQLQMEWERFAAVAIGHSLVQPALHRVTTNRFHAMRLAVEQLRKAGFQRLGLALNLDQDARVGHQWGAAFVWEQHCGRATDRTEPFLVEEGHWTERRFEKWFRANRPDVVLGYDPGIIQWVGRLGKRVPEEVGFVHLWNPDCSGQFAGIYHNPPAIGAAAVDFLVGMIQRNERGIPEAPQSLMLEARWQDGATLRAATS